MNAPRRAGFGKQVRGTLRAPHPHRLAPLSAALAGVAAGLVYWLSAQVWPSSVAVGIAMLAGTLLAEPWDSTQERDARLWFFYLLLKFSALMALSAAKLPFPAPANTALVLIMISGLAAAAALAVSGSIADHAIALALGFAPALLLGVPGLVGLALAISVALGLISYRRFIHRGQDTGQASLKLASEVAFYLGALASWSFIS